MKVLVIGSGGREHALTWKLAKSETVSDLVCTPGNPGISRHAELSQVIAEDVEGIVSLVSDTDTDLVVVGPEAPLVLGWQTNSGRMELPHSVRQPRLRESKAPNHGRTTSCIVMVFPVPRA